MTTVLSPRSAVVNCDGATYKIPIDRAACQAELLSYIPSVNLGACAEGVCGH